VGDRLYIKPSARKALRDAGKSVSAPFGYAFRLLEEDISAAFRRYDIGPVYKFPGLYRLRIGEWRATFYIESGAYIRVTLVDRRGDSTYNRQ
jgi:mRNA-degrading endonuclease RelE of RelBE toxin-antitoxin system